MANNIQLVITQDKDLNNFQTQLQNSMQPILANPINYGVLLTSINLKSGQDNSVSTTLNRKYQGWFITRIFSQTVVWESTNANSTPENILLLDCSSDVKIDLWVF